jgi:hypothetical protein
LSLGGRHDVANIVIACADCNLAKGSQNPWHFVDKLANEKNRNGADTGHDSFSQSFIANHLEARLASSRRREILQAKLLEMGVRETPELSRHSDSTESSDQLELELTTGSSFSLSIQVDGQDLLISFDSD